jgi:hypothetical protein
MPLVFATAAVGLALAWGSPVRADGYHIRHTIPREVLAYDYTTGGVMMAPPIPYGHYAKDHDLLGCAGCGMHRLLGCLGCGHDGCGHGSAHGNGCGLCGGKGCGHCLGKGLGHDGDPGCGIAGCGGGHKHHKAGKFAPCDTGVGPVVVIDPGAVMATNQSVPAGTAVVIPSGQSPCGVDGCGMKGRHSHQGGKGGHWRLCGLCHGKGCGGCGGGGMLAGCGDAGCGLCHGKGKGCGFCGGKGCGHCLSGIHGKLAGLLHHNKIEYFVGAGGPVPLTPGYVPYIVSTRSPRDFFAFPPMNPFDP